MWCCNSELYEPLLNTENPPKIGVGYVVFDKAPDKKVSATGVILLDEFKEIASFRSR